MRICIDSGHNHSGYDTGAVGNGLKEQDVTWAISSMVAEKLGRLGVETVETRPLKTTNVNNTSINASLNRRVEICNNARCDLFVSVHCNAGGGTGTETYVYSKSGKAYDLAAAVNNAILNKLPLKNRGVKTADFAVLRNTNCPAILVETAFIDNAADAKLFWEQLPDFSEAIVNGICKYLGITNEDKKEPTLEEMKNFIAEKCGYSNPADVFKCFDNHPYKAELIRKWYENLR